MEIANDLDSIEVESAVSEEAAAVAASPEILPSSSSPSHDENKNDLDLPAFMRRERRLFQ